MKLKNRIELSARDLEILQFVFEQRAVTHQQIAFKFFNNTHRSVAHERLIKISKARYLQKLSVMHKGRETLFYGMTDKGLQAFREMFRYEITNPSFKSDSVQHDLGLVEIRNRLEKMSMVTEYLSESVLQSCNGLIESEKFRAFALLNSDAALVLDTKQDQYQVALEYEISDKQEFRYAKKLTDYYFSPSVAAVFYICRNTKIEKIIRKVDSEIGQKFEAKVFTCLEKIGQREEEGMSFVNRNNEFFLLK